MNVAKINSTPAFRGTIVVPNELDNNCTFGLDGHTTFSTKCISVITKYKNGTRITGAGGDCFVSNKKVSFQDIAAAYNMAKDDLVTIDLTKSSMNLML